jgi:hypothetical protein
MIFYRPKDGSDEWDDKDHLAADIVGGDLLRELTVSYIVAITSGSGRFGIRKRNQWKNKNYRKLPSQSDTDHPFTYLGE